MRAAVTVLSSRGRGSAHVRAGTFACPLDSPLLWLATDAAATAAGAAAALLAANVPTTGTVRNDSAAPANGSAEGVFCRLGCANALPVRPPSGMLRVWASHACNDCPSTNTPEEGLEMRTVS